MMNLTIDQMELVSLQFTGKNGAGAGFQREFYGQHKSTEIFNLVS